MKNPGHPSCFSGGSPLSSEASFSGSLWPSQGLAPPVLSVAQASFSGFSRAPENCSWFPAVPTPVCISQNSFPLLIVRPRGTQRCVVQMFGPEPVPVITSLEVFTWPQDLSFCHVLMSLLQGEAAQANRHGRG